MMTPHPIMHKGRPDGDACAEQRSRGVQGEVLRDPQDVALVDYDGVGVATLKEGGKKGGREERRNGELSLAQKERERRPSLVSNSPSLLFPRHIRIPGIVLLIPDLAALTHSPILPPLLLLPLPTCTKVPSGSLKLYVNVALGTSPFPVQYCSSPKWQLSQVRQESTKTPTPTLPPTVKDVTSSPTASTRPTISWPGT